MGIRERTPARLVPPAQVLLSAAGRLTTPLRMQPKFMIIGGQRCGTTTLFKALAEHPQVARPPVDKGTDYFSLHYDRGQSWYRSRMPARGRIPTGRGVGAHAFEACTYYMFHPFAMQRIARDYPDIKLIAVLRDPVERAYSAYKHEYARGFDDEPDFMRALAREDDRLTGEIDRIRADMTYESVAHRHHAYRRRGQFAEQLERVYSLFSREQVHVMDSEAFFADPIGQYRAVARFLDLAPWTPKEIAQHNARPSAGMPSEARRFLQDHYAPHDRHLAEVLGRTPYWNLSGTATSTIAGDGRTGQAENSPAPPGNHRRPGGAAGQRP